MRGRVTLPNDQPAAGAWVILCHPHPDPERAWQRHKGPYVYRTYAAADGSFEIHGVRPGTYSLIARIDGVLGSARLDEGGWFDGVSPKCKPTEWRIHFDLAPEPR